MDCSYRPWTFRTLDCSYRPWTFRTMDYSHHHWTIRTMLKRQHLFIQCESKNPPLRFSDIFSKTVGNFQSKLCIPILRSYLRYCRLEIFIQLSPTLTNFDESSSDGTHCSVRFGRWWTFPPYHGGRVMWHNFVKVADN